VLTVCLQAIVEISLSSLRFQVDYFNNKVICDLVEAPHIGILAMLDEACIMAGKVDDKMFLESLTSKLASHKHFTCRKVGTFLIIIYFFTIYVLYAS
jgi:myosin heavy subunit